MRRSSQAARGCLLGNGCETLSCSRNFLRLMAILTTDLRPLIWSSQFPRLDFESDAPSIDFELAAVAQEPLLSLTLTTFNGAASVWGIREAVEEMMQLEYTALQDLYLRFRDTGEENFSTRKVTVVFLSLAVEPSAAPGEWLDENFLTSMPVRWLARDSQQNSISMIDLSGKPVTPSFQVSFRTSGGECRGISCVAPKPVTPVDGVSTVLFTAAELAGLASQSGNDVAQILAVTVRAGRRAATFYAREWQGDTQWTFMNAFNVEERCAFPHVKTLKSEDGRKIALVGRVASLYNRRESNEWEVESAPVSQQEAEWLAQLQLSPYVERNGREVLITDFSIEVSDAQDKMNVVKFTYRYTDGRRALEREGLREDGLFTKEYDYQYT